LCMRNRWHHDKYQQHGYAKRQNRPRMFHSTLHLILS
jgi:hypothetical protein